MSGKRRPLYGIGINDANYVVTKHEYIGGFDSKGKRKRRISWRCPYYERWKSMLRRAYCIKSKISNPTYKDCIVCAEWLSFNNFRDWMVDQDWEDKELDKDLLKIGNKKYCPEYCVFIHKKVNSFTLDRLGARGKHLLGCCVSPSNKGRFLSRCNDPIRDNPRAYLGYYATEEEAHFVWKKCKHQYSCELANSQYVTDIRIREALLTRYQNYNIVEEFLK